MRQIQESVETCTSRTSMIKQNRAHAAKLSVIMAKSAQAISESQSGRHAHRHGSRSRDGRVKFNGPGTF